MCDVYLIHNNLTRHEALKIRLHNRPYLPTSRPHAPHPPTYGWQYHVGRRLQSDSEHITFGSQTGPHSRLCQTRSLSCLPMWGPALGVPES